MAKKALIEKLNDFQGENQEGYLVRQVEDEDNIFDVHSSMEWISCPDNVKAYTHWYNPNTNSFKLTPSEINPEETAGALATDANGNLTEQYEWNWNTETWSKVQVINQ